MTKLLDFYSYRTKISHNDLKSDFKNLFSWFVYNVSEHTEIKERISTFKNEFLFLSENSTVNNIQRIEDELVSKIDTIIEKMIYAIYDELVKLHNYYSGNNNYRDHYDMPWLPAYSFNNRNLRRDWMESLLNSTLILNESQSNHPVASIITMLARFGNEAKRMVRDHLRALNKTAGIQNTNLGGTVVSTQDVKNTTPYKFSAIADTDPFGNTSNVQQTKPINVVSPATQQQNPVDTSDTFVMGNPRTGMPKTTEEKRRMDYERYKDAIEYLKQEKDISKFLKAIEIKKGVPTLKKILIGVTNIKDKRSILYNIFATKADLIEFAKKWHMKTFGYQSQEKPDVLQGQSATATPMRKRGRPKKDIVTTQSSEPVVSTSTPEPKIEEPIKTEPSKVAPVPQEIKKTETPEIKKDIEVKKVLSSKKKKTPNENTIIVKDANEIGNVITKIAQQYNLKQGQQDLITDLARNLSDNFEINKFDFNDLFLLIQDTIKQVLSQGGDRNDIEQKLIEKIKAGDIPYLDDNSPLVKPTENDDQASDDDIAAYRNRRGR